MRPSKYLDEKVIWISGASGGLGRELAIALAKYNVKLILSARQDLKLKETRKLTGLPDHRCLIVPLDLTHLKEDQIEMIEDRILLKFGSLDIIIHSASLSQRSLAYKTLEPVERQIMETNFFGPVKLTKCVLPTLLKSSAPQIVILSSFCGKYGVPLRSSYSAAKHALHGFFESMSVELHKELGVCFFVLGGLRTDAAKNALSADGSKNDQLDIWHSKLMPPSECAKRIIKKLPQKRGEFLIGGIERLGIVLNRYFPKIHKSLMFKFFSREKKTLKIK